MPVPVTGMPTTSPAVLAAVMVVLPTVVVDDATATVFVGPRTSRPVPALTSPPSPAPAGTPAICAVICSPTALRPLALFTPVDTGELICRVDVVPVDGVNPTCPVNAPMKANVLGFV